MAVYRFRVTFEDHDEVSRDIEIRSTQTFEDLHHAIHSFIGFDASKPASFYMSDDNWKKGKEITSRDLKAGEKEKVKPMRGSRLLDVISDPHQKIYYIFDPAVQWAFRIELIKIIVNEEIGASYPRCVKITGEAPKQYLPTIASVPPPDDYLEDPTVEPLIDDVAMEEGIEEDEIPSSIDKNDEADTEEESVSDDEVIDQEEEDEL